ncbi:MAG: VanW family protein [Solirubrobacterales bacterium]
MQTLRNKAIIGIVAGIIMLSGTILATSKILEYRDQQVVPPGIRVGGVAIGGLMESKAVQKLQAELKGSTDRYLVFESTRGTARLPFDRYGIDYDYPATIAHAQTGDRTGFASATTYHVWVRGGSSDLTPVLHWNPDMMPEIMRDLKAKLERDPRNASVLYRNGVLDQRSDQVGYKLDQEQAQEAVKTALNTGNAGHIRIALTEIQPRIKMDEIVSIKDMLGVFATTLDQSQKGRTKNIERAAKQLDGTIVMPNETFSMNETLGPRTGENGYVKAPVLTSKGIKRDLGGGICQVATTLYDAVMQANLQIVERQPHSKPVDYAPDGLDATILGDQVDFRFKNTSKDPVMISALMRDDKLYLRVFGTQSATYDRAESVTDTQVVQPRVTVRYDPSLSKGVKIVKTKGTNGKRTRTFQVLYKNGKEVSRKLIDEQYKPGKDEVVVYGSRPSGAVRK